MASAKKAAVITGDIINSSKLPFSRRKRVNQLLQSFLKNAPAQWSDWQAEQYRGDSLQAQLTRNRSLALRVALQLYCVLAKEKLHIRLSIGVGDISFVANNVLASDGSAFHASGAHLDTLKKSGGLISIASTETNFTEEWQAHSASLDFVMRRWTPPQAEAIYLQLQQHTQEQMAEKLKISQPSVHQRLQAAGAPVVQKIVSRFESVVPSL